MSPEDQDPPVHRISRIEEREKLLAEAMAHAEAQEAQYKVIPADAPLVGRWKTPVALMVFVAAGLVGLFPPSWVAGPPLATVQDGELERGVRVSIALQALQVEVFRLRNDRLPDDLAEVPGRFADLRLVKSNNRVFQIVGRRPGGETLVYDSAHPSPAFAGAEAFWSGDGTP